MWLENDVVEGISKEQADQIIAKLKIPPTGGLSPIQYNITMSVMSYLIRRRKPLPILKEKGLVGSRSLRSLAYRPALQGSGMKAKALKIS